MVCNSRDARRRRRKAAGREFRTTAPDTGRFFSFFIIAAIFVASFRSRSVHNVTVPSGAAARFRRFCASVDVQRHCLLQPSVRPPNNRADRPCCVVLIGKVIGGDNLAARVSPPQWGWLWRVRRLKKAKNFRWKWCTLAHFLGHYHFCHNNFSRHLSTWGIE